MIRVRSPRSDWPVTVTTFGVFATFQALLSAVPVQAALNEQSASAAGYMTAYLMASAIAGQLVTTWLLARFDAGRVTAFGATLCALSSVCGLMFGLSSAAAVIQQCTRGIGFGIVSVASAAILVADVAPESRGSGLAKLALVTGAPGVAMAPLGLLLLEHWSINAVFGACLVLSGIGLPFILAMPRVGPKSAREDDGETARLPVVVWIYALSFLGVSAAWMTFMSYMPLVHGSSAAPFVAGCLLLASSVRAGARYLAAYSESTLGVGRTLVGSTALALAGSVLVLAVDHLALAFGALLLGLGLGMYHSSVYLGMLNSASSSGLRAVGVIWNVCIDLGGLFGSTLAGLVTHGGNPGPGLAIVPWFLVSTAGAMLCLPVLRRRSRSETLR